MKNKFGNLVTHKLSKEQMRQTNGGYGQYPHCDNRDWKCGCLDVEGVFYPGPCGGGYCFNTYGAEPWCVRK
jgi:hypothetical protein